MDRSPGKSATHGRVRRRTGPHSERVGSQQLSWAGVSALLNATAGAIEMFARLELHQSLYRRTPRAQSGLPAAGAETVARQAHPD
jgi:hypothetical protein